MDEEVYQGSMVGWICMPPDEYEQFQRDAHLGRMVREMPLGDDLYYAWAVSSGDPSWVYHHYEDTGWQNFWGSTPEEALEKGGIIDPEDKL